MLLFRSWASAGGQNGHLRPLKIGTKKQKFLEKGEISSLILISWVNSCNDRLFADMTLTLHKNQVNCFGNMLLWASQLTKSASLPAGCENRERKVLLLPLLCNNNMATYLRTCTSSHGGRRFAQCCHFWCFQRNFWCLMFWLQIWCWLGCCFCFPYFTLFLWWKQVRFIIFRFLSISLTWCLLG